MTDKPTPITKHRRYIFNNPVRFVGDPVAAVAAVESAAARAGIYRVAIRCQTRYADALRALVARGYQVRWTDLRMTLADYPERHPATGVLFSNWEI